MRNQIILVIVWVSILAAPGVGETDEVRVTKPSSTPGGAEVLTADDWRTQADPDSLEPESIQASYVRGFADAVALLEWLGADSLKGDLYSCGSGGFDAQQLVQTLNRFYTDYPQFSHYSPGVVILDALTFLASSPERSLPSPAQLVPYDEPPVSISKAKINYPFQALQAGIEGTVWVKVLIDTNGNVRDAEIFESSDTTVGFEEEALRAAYQNKYKPAVARDRPVAVWVVYPVHFRLK